MANETHRRTTFTDVLRLPEFRALFIAQILSQLGDNLARVAVALLVYSRSHSPFLTSLSLALTFLTWVAVGPILAAFADRYPRRSVMITADLARAVLVAFIAIPGIPLALILVLVTLVSLLEPPFQSARSATMPAILTDEADYAVGLSLGSVAAAASVATGYAAGGLAVAWIGTGGTILFDAITFTLSAAILLFRAPFHSTVKTSNGSLWTEIREGASFVFNDVALLWLAGVSALVLASVITGLGLAIPYAHEHSAGNGVVGLLSASTVVGSLFGGTILGRWVKPRLAQQLMLPLAFLAPIIVLSMLFNPTPGVAALIFVAASTCDSMSITANRIFVQRLPNTMRGRAFGIAASMIFGAQGLAVLTAGRLAENVDAAQAMVIIAFVCLAAISLLTVFAISRAPQIFAIGALTRVRAPHETASSSSAAAPKTGRDSLTYLEGPVNSRRVAQGSMAHARILVGILLLSSIWLASQDLVGKRAYLQLRGALIVIAALYIVALGLPLKFNFRGTSRIFQPETIPLVLGLFFLQPWELVTIRALAHLLTKSSQLRTSRTKLAFNIVASSLTCQLSVDLFRLIAGTPRGAGANTWIAALASEAVDATVAFGLFVLVIKFAMGSIEGVTPISDMSFMLPISFVCTFLALIEAGALLYDPANAWAIVVFAIFIGLGLRTYHRLSESHGALDRLYVIARELGAVGTDPVDLHPALEQLRRVIGADVVELHAANSAGIMLKTSVTGATDGGVLLVSEEPLTDVPRVYAPTTGSWARRLAQRMKMQRASYAHEIAVPLPIDSIFTTVLTVRLDPTKSVQFESADVRVVEAAAAQLAVALEKGELVASLRQAAERDKLTGLANLESLRSFMATTFEGGPGGVLLILDIDRFHEINDTLGREVGDAVLSEVARRLDASPGQAGLAARVGSDQFALAIPGQASSELARLAALAVKSRTDGSMRFETLNADVRITIGIARAPEHGVTANILLRRAEMAMTAAKGTSGGIGEWEPDYEKDGSRRIQLLAGLRQALAEGSLDVAYQPKLRLSTGEVTGFEALVRWNHPTLGPVSPVEFVPLTEATGLIGALTSHVLRQALATCRRWHDDGKPVGVAVNISPRSLDDPVLVGQVAAMLTASGLSPHWLTLEITESSLMENKERALDVLHQLRMLGVRLSIDDFGTGYSSLNQLRGLPAHEVKIDRSFVDTVDEGGPDLAVVRAIVDLCDSMGLTTVAEGVERASQAFALESLGVPIVQGYFYGKPMPADAASTWLEARPTLAVTVDQ